MNLTLTLQDYLALSPFLIITSFALLILLLESFANHLARRFSIYLACFSIALAFVATAMTYSSTHPLLTPWIRFDALKTTFNALFLGVGFVSCLLGKVFLDKEVHSKAISAGEYYFLLLSSLFGLMLIGASNDFLTLFIGIETLSIPLYILAVYIKRVKVSGEAALKYFLMGGLAAAFLVYGVAFVYGAVGTTNFQSLSTAYGAMKENGGNGAYFFSGLAMIMGALAFKAALVPFHNWAPDVYQGAPTPVVAFMAVGTKLGAMAAFAIVFLIAMPNIDNKVSFCMAALAAITLVYANFVATRQTQLRRFFAYSGMSHAAFMLIAILTGSSEAISALVLYFIVYALATMGAFAVLATLGEDDEELSFEAVRGLFSKSPFLALAFSLCLLTLAGIPPTAGFLAKFYVLKLAYYAGYQWLVALALLTAVLAAFYYLRLMAIMFTVDALPRRQSPKVSRPAFCVAAIAGLALIYVSLFPFLG